MKKENERYSILGIISIVAALGIALYAFQQYNIHLGGSLLIWHFQLPWMYLGWGSLAYAVVVVSTMWKGWGTIVADVVLLAALGGFTYLYGNTWTGILFVVVGFIFIAAVLLRLNGHGSKIGRYEEGGVALDAVTILVFILILILVLVHFGYDFSSISSAFKKFFGLTLMGGSIHV